MHSKCDSICYSFAKRFWFHVVVVVDVVNTIPLPMRTDFSHYGMKENREKNEEKRERERVRTSESVRIVLSTQYGLRFARNSHFHSMPFFGVLLFVILLQICCRLILCQFVNWIAQHFYTMCVCICVVIHSISFQPQPLLYTHDDADGCNLLWPYTYYTYIDAQMLAHPW